MAVYTNIIKLNTTGGGIKNFILSNLFDFTPYL